MVNLASTKAQNTARLLALMGKTADIFRSAWRDQNTAKWRELEMRAELARQQRTETYREAQLGLAGKREARAERKEVWEQEKYAEEAPIRAEELEAARGRTAASRERTGVMRAGQVLAGQQEERKIREARRDLLTETEKGFEAEGKSLFNAMELTEADRKTAREELAPVFSLLSMGSQSGFGALFGKNKVDDIISDMAIEREAIMADWGRALAALPQGKQPETFLEALEFMPHTKLKGALKAEYEGSGKDAAKAEVGWEIHREQLYAYGELALASAAARGDYLGHGEQSMRDRDFMRQMRFGDVLSDEWMADLRAWTRERGQDEPEPAPEPIPAPGPDIMDILGGSTGTSSEW